jgi:hypothetical protein
MKLLMKYESVTQKVLLLAKYNFLNYIFTFRKQFWKTIARGYPDSNLESLCISDTQVRKQES